jgi:predicted ATPase
MAKIEGFRIQNFGVLHDVTLGRLWNRGERGGELTPLTAVIGKNGAGKSTLFDALGFLADCLKYGVEDACDRNGRGGYERIRSQGILEPIAFEIYYREEHNARPITYEVTFDLDSGGRPYVKSERLRQRRKGQSRGRPFSFLILENGVGMAWKGEHEGVQANTVTDLSERVETNESVKVELDDNRKLGIATLGSLKEHPRVAKFRRFIEGWYLSYFTPDAARDEPKSGAQKHLNIHGDNIGNVVQFMERDHPKQFQKVLEAIAAKIPGVEKISTELMPNGRLLLKFNDKGFSDPFSAQQMSDGTLKVFAYLLLLNDPTPPPFLCIEEPENGLYHGLLETLAAEFRAHVTSGKGASQIFVTTHQPYFVDALEASEVWILEKGNDGFSSIRRASADPVICDLVAEELPLGGLWYSDYLEGDTKNAF